MTMIHAMLSNAAIAALVAIIAVAVGYACRSPVVRHAAWVLVLLKLVTPPLFIIPLSVLPASWAARPTDPPANTVLVLSLSAIDPSSAPAETMLGGSCRRRRVARRPARNRTNGRTAMVCVRLRSCCR